MHFFFYQNSKSKFTSHTYFFWNFKYHYFILYSNFQFSISFMSKKYAWVAWAKYYSPQKRKIVISRANYPFIEMTRSLGRQGIVKYRPKINGSPLLWYMKTTTNKLSCRWMALGQKAFKFGTLFLLSLKKLLD